MLAIRSVLLLLTLALATIGIVEAKNCFYNGQVTYVYHIEDSENIFPDAREYKLRKNTTCEILAQGNTKLTFYSDAVSAKYHVYYDRDDGLGCRMPKEEENLYDEYNSGNIIYSGYESQEFAREQGETGEVCLVKYQVSNSDEESSQRIQLFRTVVNSAMFGYGMKALYAVSMVYLGLVAIDI